MVHKLTLPKFDANITEAALGAWHKSEGERVEAGDVLVDVITDKANFELTAQAPGVLRKIVAPEKSQVPLGYVIALVGDPGDELPDVTAENSRLMREYLASATGKAVPIVIGMRPGPSSGVPAQPGAVPISSGGERVRATPRARRLAREHGIDLADVSRWIGTGVEIVTEEHVQRLIKERKS